jgi:hypothetical protein
MIGISRLAKAYGGRTLFEDVSLQLNAGSREWEEIEKVLGTLNPRGNPGV